MRKIMMAAVAAAVLLAAPACTKQEPAAEADPITGTWKADLASVQIDEKPSVYLLKDGTYSCSTCVPPLTVTADGAFHPVADRPYYDSMSVTVVDERAIKSVRKKGDRVVSEATIAASADGNSLTTDFIDSTTLNAPPVTGKVTETRVAAAPPGSHAISGSWKTGKIDAVSDEGLTFSYRVEGDTLHMSSPSGQSYDAKMGGTDVPVKGDTGGTTVSVERLAPNSIRETFKRGGKTVAVTTYTAADGKLAAVNQDKLQGSTMKYTALKQ